MKQLKRWHKYALFLFGIPCLLWSVYIVSSEIQYQVQYKSLKRITLTDFDDIPLTMTIPIRHRSRANAFDALCIPLRTDNGWVFRLRRDDRHGEPMLYVLRWDAIGLGSHLAAYEITDGALRKKLGEMLDRQLARRKRDVVKEANREVPKQ